MDEIEEANDDIDLNMLAFIGNNNENFNFNTFKMPLNFVSNIYNVKISLKEAKFEQKDLETKVGGLRFGYKSKTKEEKEKKGQVLIKHKTCWNLEMKLLMHLKMVFFCLNI